jgi:hypothetical protein
MEEPRSFENYSLRYVIVSNLLSFSIYAVGAFIIYHIGLVWLTGYVLFVLVLEIQLMRGHCVDCYYYGKTCAFGKGRLSCIFFKQGKSEHFFKRQITWMDILPDFLVFYYPSRHRSSHITPKLQLVSINSFQYQILLALLSFPTLRAFGLSP